MPVNGDNIANCVLAAFDGLPSKSKPRRRTDEKREWVPLSGIVLEKAGGPLECVALATGMKCLPTSRLPQASGNILHDSHAEILAIRAFNRFLLDECAALKADSNRFVRRREWIELSDEEPQPFALVQDVKIHMYCSEAPCGDASMELTMAAQKDVTPWEVPPAAEDGAQEKLRGRGYFSELGIVRRKPSRPDAPPTLSKSCSDKLALKQFTSLLSTLASFILSPRSAYLSTLTLPRSQYIADAISRTFSPIGRLAPLTLHSSPTTYASWQEAGYSFTPFETLTTEREFVYSRRSVSYGLEKESQPVASNISALWTPRVHETLVNGARQGRKAGDLRGASAVSRRRLWEAVVAIVDAEGKQRLNVRTYRELKEVNGDIMLAKRQAVKKASKKLLLGWKQNVGDDYWEMNAA
ncbi:adenosine deaminase/editase [Lineolata rhizophorae]|uniref:Adenosine deaminase/editase n=1 Tax=Lineolata rhizophorae TaxID=578093 RepID=A0A6A6NWJ7_9PEZI|nr:adenosine deaminase/editase [Lineolata rhizophorae]